MANTAQKIIIMHSFIKHRISYISKKGFLLFFEKLRVLLNTYLAPWNYIALKLGRKLLLKV